MFYLNTISIVHIDEHFTPFQKQNTFSPSNFVILIFHYTQLKLVYK